MLDKFLINTKALIKEAITKIETNSKNIKTNMGKNMKKHHPFCIFVLASGMDRKLSTRYVVLKPLFYFDFMHVKNFITRCGYVSVS